MSTAAATATDAAVEPKEVYLEADKEIPGQHYVALSFLSPNSVLENKDVFFFSEFLKDYEVQYKIKSTETFVMAQVAALQTALSTVQDRLIELQTSLQTPKGESATSEPATATVATVATTETVATVATVATETVATDLSGVLATVADLRKTLTADAVAAMEAHVKANMADFKKGAIKEAYDTFMYKNKKKLDDDFFAANSFRTTVQGLKVRGVFDTYGEAVNRAKTLQKIDPSFNVFVGQVGFWLPWDPEPHTVADQEYADDQLNQLMKKYKENEATRDELYAQDKVKRMGNAKVQSAATTAAAAAAAATATATATVATAATAAGTSAGKTTSSVGGGAAAETEATPTAMFGDDDLVIRRKRERKEEEERAKAAKVIEKVIENKLTHH